MIRLLLFLTLVTGLAACVAPTTTQQPFRPDQIEFPVLQFSFPTIEQQQFANGMKLYLNEDHELPLVDLTLQIGGGSILDPVTKTGLSQLFAQTLETGGAGGASPAELETELETMAAKLSVSSSTYCYQIDLSLHQRDLSRGLKILADLLRRPQFAEDRLEFARTRILEGIRRKNDDPGEIAGRLLAKAVYPGHSFGSFPQRSVVEQFKRADLLDLHQRFFRPDNVWLAVSGAVYKDELIRLLENNFADWQAVATELPELPELPSAPAGRILLADKKIPQTSILMGHPGISKDNPDLFALQVANYIFGGGGFNSRLMREVRSNRGLAYSVYSYFKVGRRLPELFIAASETKTESTVEVVSLMRQLMQQMIDEPVSEKELQLAKQSLINSFVFAFTNSHSVVSRKVRLDFYNYPDNYLETYQQKISAVTVDDVIRVSGLYFHPHDLQIVLVGDTSEFSEAIKELGPPLETVALTEEM